MTESNAWSDPDPGGRMIWAVRRADLAVQAVKERGLRPLGIVTAHYSLLAAVHDEPGLAGAELARRLSVSPQAVGALVARLVDRGYLERREHPRHRQVQELHLTKTGRRVFSEADVVITDIERRAVGGLGADDARSLTSLLNRLTALSAEL